MSFSEGEAPFSWRATQAGEVRISWNHKEVTLLRGKEAARFLRRIEGADEAEAQHLMARVTGNFKRGNERQGKGAR